MRARAWVAWLFMLPTLLVMAVIVFIPLVQSVAYSFTDLTNRNQGTIFKPPSWQFIGLENYTYILGGGDPNFYPVLTWTIVWTVVNVFFHFTLGLILALALNQRFRGRTTYRLLLMLPWAVPAYITAISWRFLFNGEYGLFNALLGSARALRCATGKIARYIIVTIGVFVAIGTLGVDTSAIMAGGAVLLVGIGFGLQKLAENFISGLLVLIERPIKKGDFIDAGGVLGTVEDIGLRATRVMSRDGVAVIVPNSNLMSSTVINYSAPTPERRFWIQFGVAYGSDLDLVVRVW